MSKQLILDVTCVNDFASDTPTVMAIQISASLAARIKMLAAAVKDLGVEAVKEFNYDGIWSPLMWRQLAKPTQTNCQPCLKLSRLKVTP